MVFYKVVKGDRHDWYTGYTTVLDELVTTRERNTKFKDLTDDVFEKVNISIKKTVWIFGARFEIKE